MVREPGRGAREKRRGERRRGSWEVVVITNKDLRTMVEAWDDRKRRRRPVGLKIWLGIIKRKLIHYTESTPTV